MAKLGIFASIFTIIAALGIATQTSTAAPTACNHKEFKTELVKNACDKGGQPEAKNAMKQFMKDAKIKSCNACHSKLAPSYELKADAVDQFKKAGGKLLDAPK
ncbi:MAG TPA: hypothetical protein VLX92_17495 [Kofleriaceae bacterium]|nr:hypothetical protein [Kofleriaceae bacterium]